MNFGVFFAKFRQNQQMQQMSGMMMPDGSMCMMQPMNMMGQDGTFSTKFHEKQQKDIKINQFFQILHKIKGNMMCGPDGNPIMMGDMSGQGMSCGSGKFHEISSKSLQIFQILNRRSILINLSKVISNK